MNAHAHTPRVANHPKKLVDLLLARLLPLLGAMLHRVHCLMEATTSGSRSLAGGRVALSGGGPSRAAATAGVSVALASPPKQARDAAAARSVGTRPMSRVMRLLSTLRAAAAGGGGGGGGGGAATAAPKAAKAASSAQQQGADDGRECLG
jgi:hypothetical protein